MCACEFREIWKIKIQFMELDIKVHNEAFLEIHLHFDFTCDI